MTLGVLALTGALFALVFAPLFSIGALGLWALALGRAPKALSVVTILVITLSLALLAVAVLTRLYAAGCP